MNAKYNFGGVSKRLGKFKVRVGQGDMVTRIKAMMKAGHEDIELIEFDEKLTKAQICEKLLKMEKFKNFESVIKETHDKKMGLVAKAASPAKPTKNKKPATKKAQPTTAQKKKSAVKKPKVVIKSPVQDAEDDLLIEEIKQLAV
jgi:hypothetical protein